METYQPLQMPLLRLFRLTLQVKGKKQSNAYSMGENVEDAFKRYLARVIKMEENIQDIEFIEGDLADPHTRTRK